jgi:hypothetical protein
MVAAKRAARRDGVRVFGPFSWLEIGSVEVALPCPSPLRYGDYSDGSSLGRMSGRCKCRNTSRWAFDILYQ